MSFDLTDALNIENGTENEFEFFASLQRAINSGAAWRLQGSFGRAAMAAIKAGKCVLGRQGHSDYYGNYVPSRDDVGSGTRGSVAFAAERSGEEWATEIAAIE